MKNDKDPMKPAAFLWLIVAAMLVLGALFPPQALAQLPARFYLKPLEGTEAVPIIYESVTGNTNPFDPAQTEIPAANGVSFDATMTLSGYVKFFPLFDRSVMALMVVPMGHVSGDVTVAGKTVTQSSNGFGDPMIEFDINVIGPPAQRTIPDGVFYEPGFSLDLLADLFLPLGEYDDKQVLNLGQNRWYGRLGAPIIWQLGPWVPGRRATLELLPAVYLFGANDDYNSGNTLRTDPKYQLDAHLTRDLMDHAWASLDATWYKGAQAYINGTKVGSKVDIFGCGLTLGYHVNDNASLTVGYKSTIDSSNPGNLRMDVFMVTLVIGWHPIIEGSKRLKEE
jgi:hypothetical protein